jgi:hypothetical protein
MALDSRPPPYPFFSTEAPGLVISTGYGRVRPAENLGGPASPLHCSRSSPMRKETHSQVFGKAVPEPTKLTPMPEDRARGSPIP